LWVKLVIQQETIFSIVCRSYKLMLTAPVSVCLSDAQSKYCQ